MADDQLLGSILNRLDSLNDQMLTFNATLGSLVAKTHAPGSCGFVGETNQRLINMEENQNQARGAARFLVGLIAALGVIMTAGFAALAFIFE